MKFILALLVLLAAVADAQTLYKSVGPDGKPTYSDKPPQDGKVQKTLKVNELPNTALPAAVSTELEAIRRSGAKAATPTASTVLYAAAWCGYCRQARAYLAKAGIKYQEIDIDTPSGKAAFASVSGAGGVPLLVVKGEQLRGYSELAYDNLFARHK